MNIDPAVVVEHIQKQAGESEVIKFALDAAMRQAVIVEKDRTIEMLEAGLEQEKRKVRELQEAIINGLEDGTEAGRALDGQAPQGSAKGNGRGDPNELAGRPGLVRGGGAAK